MRTQTIASPPSCRARGTSATDASSTRTALKALPAGSFYTEPPGIDHFAMTKGEPVVIQITGTGPSGTTYADPRNDPARKP